MSSIWKDLLFLQGYLVRKEDLVWRSDTAPEPNKSEAKPVQAVAVPSSKPRDCGTPACA